MNKKLNNNCIYFHVNFIKQEVFYVGMGKIERPYYDGEERSDFWHNEVNKYNYDIMIIHTNLSRKESCELEKQYIKQIGRRDLGLGALVNHTDGGDGGDNFTNHPNKEEIRRKCSGDNNANRKATKGKRFPNRHNTGYGKGVRTGMRGVNWKGYCFVYNSDKKLIGRFDTVNIAATTLKIRKGLIHIYIQYKHIPKRGKGKGKGYMFFQSKNKNFSI